MKQLLSTFAIILSLLVASVCVAQAQGTVRYVKEKGTGDGSSWANASGDLQKMIDASSAGDEVWVAAGTYNPSTLIKSSKKRSFAFILKNGVSLYGGFVGDETDRNARAKSEAPAPMEFLYTHKTILDADIDDKEDDWKRRFDDGSFTRYIWDIAGNGGNANHILFLKEAATQAIVIDGFILSGAYADVWNVKSAGAALYAEGNVQLLNSVVKQNATYTRAEGLSYEFKGGAVYMNGEQATVRNCLFEQNYAFMPTMKSYGGSVYMEKGVVEKCLFRESVSPDEGGALFLQEGTARDCSFYDCYAARGGAVFAAKSRVERCFIAHARGLLGGGIFAEGSIIHHSVVTNCYADDPSFGDTDGGKGGGIYATQKSKIVGSVVANSSAFKGGALFLKKESQAVHSTLVNSVARSTEGATGNLFMNENSKEINCIHAVDVAAGNFVKPTTRKGFSEEKESALRQEAEEADWSLAEGSAFIGSGELDPSTDEPKDMKGNDRLNAEGKIDRGALAYQKESEPQPADPNMVLTLTQENQELTMSLGGVAGTSFSVDWGDGEKKTYDGAKTLTGAVKGNKVQIYGSDIMIFRAISQGLSTLEIKAAPQLAKLTVTDNQLTKLDLKNCPALKFLYCGTNQIEHPLDLSAQTQMMVLSCPRNKISGRLDLAHITGLTSIECYNNAITELKLPTDATVLTQLDCDSNRLQLIDLATCTALTELNCAENELTSLDVEKNIKLKKIYAIGNKLKQVSIATNTELETLTLTNNQLSSLDLSKSTNLQNLYLGNNQLTGLDLTNNEKLAWFVVENNRLSELNLSKQKGLMQVRASGNNLSTIDLSQNPELVTVMLSNNQLQELDLSAQKKLIWLTCTGNKLTTLDLSKNHRLSWLECGQNNLSSLNLAEHKSLQKLFADNNKLTMLKIKGQSALNGIRIENNLLPAAELNVILASLPDVKALEINENNRDWAKKVDISYNPGTGEANLAPAQANGWEVKAITAAQILDEKSFGKEFYSSQSDCLMIAQPAQRISLFDISGAHIVTLCPGAVTAVPMSGLHSQGGYVAVVEYMDGSTAVSFFRK